MLQRAGQRAAEIGHPDPLDPVVCDDPQGNDRVRGIRVFGKPGERFIVRQEDDPGLDRRNLHSVLPVIDEPP
jgi:hypothetical protein